jgi:outer membrane protein OmpA-like peptidoglycan-associated protein
VTPNNFVVQFASASYAISADYQSVLNNVIRIAKLIGATKFVLTGHTDSDGNLAANQVLSENRASAVEKFILSKIKNAQFTNVGQADTAPVATNNTAAGKAANRRVEIKIS